MNIEAIQSRIWTELTKTPLPPNDEICPLCGGTGYISLNLPISHELFGRAFHCVCRRNDVLARRVTAALHDAGDKIPDESYEYDWEDFEKLSHARPALQAAVQLTSEGAVKVGEKTKNGLLLIGPTGTGKSTLALLILRQMSAAGEICAWTDWTDLVKRVQSTYDKSNPTGTTEREIIDAVSKPALTVLDDLGSLQTNGQASENRIEILFQVVNYRYAHRLPTVITSNLNVKGLEIQFGARVMSRVLSLCQPIEMNGKDLRI